MPTGISKYVLINTGMQNNNGYKLSRDLNSYVRTYAGFTVRTVECKKKLT